MIFCMMWTTSDHCSVIAGLGDFCAHEEVYRLAVPTIIVSVTDTATYEEMLKPIILL